MPTHSAALGPSSAAGAPAATALRAHTHTWTPRDLSRDLSVTCHVTCHVTCRRHGARTDGVFFVLFVMAGGQAALALARCARRWAESTAGCRTSAGRKGGGHKRCLGIACCCSLGCGRMHTRATWEASAATAAAPARLLAVEMTASNETMATTAATAAAAARPMCSRARCVTCSRLLARNQPCTCRSPWPGGACRR